jgi:hypothetical protein
VVVHPQLNFCFRSRSPHIQFSYQSQKISWNIISPKASFLLGSHFFFQFSKLSKFSKLHVAALKDCSRVQLSRSRCPRQPRCQRQAPRPGFQPRAPASRRPLNPPAARRGARVPGVRPWRCHWWMDWWMSLDWLKGKSTGNHAFPHQI